MTLKRLCIIAAASASLAITPAAIGAEAPKTGPFTGPTSQGTSIKLTVERDGSGRIVRWITIGGRVQCEDGSVEAVKISRLVLGVRVRDGRFRIQMSDLDLRGRFVTPRRIEGKYWIDAEFSPCKTTGLSYHAINR